MCVYYILASAAGDVRVLLCGSGVDDDNCGLHNGFDEHTDISIDYNSVTHVCISIRKRINLVVPNYSRTLDLILQRYNNIVITITCT